MSDDEKNVVSIKDLKDNEKLPKGLIKRYPTEERKHGITDFRCSVSKSYSYNQYTDLKVTGELKGRVTKYTLMMFVVYNRNDELIEAVFDETIDKDLVETWLFQ